MGVARSRVEARCRWGADGHGGVAGLDRDPRCFGTGPRRDDRHRAGEIRDAIKAAPDIVVVDLSAVAFSATSGLSVLLEAGGRARAACCRLVVIAGDGPAQQLFERTDAQQVLTIAS